MEVTRTGTRAASGRTALARLLALVVACSGIATAHGSHGGGPPVGFAVAVAVPVLAGLACGWAAVSRRLDEVSVPRAETALGVALLALGLAFLLPAVADEPIRSAVLAVGSGVAARLLLGHGATHRGSDAALAAVCVHRFVEGSVLAVAYGVGTAVGAFGTAVLAGHAAVEAAVIGGLYARTAGLRAHAAVVGVQASFVLGALVGESAVPSSDAAGVAVLAAAGGVVFAAGLGETGWASAVGRRQVVARLR